MGLLDGKVLANYETGVFMKMYGAKAKKPAKKSAKPMGKGKKKK
jgi:hypothetical protein